MNKTTIIAKIAKERLVEETIIKYINHYGINDVEPDTLDDLAQMIYLALLEKDDELIEHLYDKGDIGFYVYRMVSNQVSSKTSPFYKMFRGYNVLNNNRLKRSDEPYEGDGYLRDC